MWVSRGLRDYSLISFARDPLRGNLLRYCRYAPQAFAGISFTDPLRVAKQQMRAPTGLVYSDSDPYKSKLLARRHQNKRPRLQRGHSSVAERKGFEPPVQLPGQRFSRPPQSTTLASLRSCNPLLRLRVQI